MYIVLISVSHSVGKRGLMKSTTVTVDKELRAEDRLLKDPLKIPATQTPVNPGIQLNLETI